jgi:hypothetical protein
MKGFGMIGMMKMDLAAGHVFNNHLPASATGAAKFAFTGVDMQFL